MIAILLAIQIALVSALGTLSITVDQADDSLWSTLPAIIAAFGTVAAFGVALALFLRESRDRIREQASKVYVFSQLDRATGEVRAVIRNKSDLPIWSVEANPLRDERPFADDIFQTRPDIEPGQQFDLTFHDSADSIDRHWRLRFLDAAGRDWERIGNGLKRVGSRRVWRRRRRS